jgi:hypothetical protein
MPLQRTETYTTTGTKASWNCDPSITPFALSVMCALISGTVDYKLQYSYDTLDGPLDTDASAVWIDSDGIPAGTTGSAEENFSGAPIARIRVVIASISGSLKVTMLQGFSSN